MAAPHGEWRGSAELCSLWLRQGPRERRGDLKAGTVLLACVCARREPCRCQVVPALVYLLEQAQHPVPLGAGRTAGSSFA